MKIYLLKSLVSKLSLKNNQSHNNYFFASFFMPVTNEIEVKTYFGNFYFYRMRLKCIKIYS